MANEIKTGIEGGSFLTPIRCWYHVNIEKTPAMYAVRDVFGLLGNFIPTGSLENPYNRSSKVVKPIYFEGQVEPYKLGDPQADEVGNYFNLEVPENQARILQ